VVFSCSTPAVVELDFAEVESLEVELKVMVVFFLRLVW
jgi:hypothetical protein